MHTSIPKRKKTRRAVFPAEEQRRLTDEKDPATVRTAILPRSKLTPPSSTPAQRLLLSKLHSALARREEGVEVSETSYIVTDRRAPRMPPSPHKLSRTRSVLPPSAASLTRRSTRPFERRSHMSEMHRREEDPSFEVSSHDVSFGEASTIREDDDVASKAMTAATTGEMSSVELMALMSLMDFDELLCLRICLPQLFRHHHNEYDSADDESAESSMLSSLNDDDDSGILTDDESSVLL